MNFHEPSLNQYIEAHTSPEPPTLQQLNRQTHAQVLRPRMLSGHVQGRLLAMFSQMIRPQAVLEIGTYTGYSAICLAEGLAEGGKVYTIDINEELETLVRGYFVQAGVADQVDYHIGNALDVIPTIQTTFDLVFIDADKMNYARYYDLLIDRIRPGGFLIADNVLWSGKVLETAQPDADTQNILNFNQKIQEDSRVENVLIPIRDGLMVIRKK